MKEKYKEILLAYGYRYIEGECKNTNSKLKCYDTEGYIVYPSLYKLQNSNKRPRRFDKSNKSSINNINRYLYLHSNGEYICVSNEYLNNTSKLNILHTKCNNVFQTSWTYIQRTKPLNIVIGNSTGACCPFCHLNRKESVHASVLKQVWIHEYPDTICEDSSCINPETKRVLPTDIVNHHLKIAIEIQSKYHDTEKQKIKDEIKKKFWKNKGYKFYSPDIRNYSIIDIIQMFFPNISEIPSYVVLEYEKCIDYFHVQKLLNDGLSVPEISSVINCNPHRIYDGLHSGKLQYPDDYKKRYLSPVVQLDVNYNFIRRYTSISEAERLNDINEGRISACLLKKRNYSSGYIWLYESDYESKNYIISTPRSKKFLIPVIQYDKTGKVIKEYPTIIEASKELNVQNSDIFRVVQGERKTIKGFKFKKATY